MTHSTLFVVGYLRPHYTDGCLASRGNPERPAEAETWNHNS